jgi:hypothetical protein
MVFSGVLEGRVSVAAIVQMKTPACQPAFQL